MRGVIEKTQRAFLEKFDLELLVKALNSKAISWVSFDLCENRRGHSTRICATSLVFQSLADWPTPSAWRRYASKLTHSHTLRFDTFHTTDALTKPVCPCTALAT